MCKYYSLTILRSSLPCNVVAITFRSAHSFLRIMHNCCKTIENQRKCKFVFSECEVFVARKGKCTSVVTGSLFPSMHDYCSALLLSQIFMCLLTCQALYKYFNPLKSSGYCRSSQDLTLTRQVMNVQRNNGSRSCNYCCSGKAISVPHSECVFVFLDIQHAVRMRHIVRCGASGFTIFFHII